MFNLCSCSTTCDNMFIFNTTFVFNNTLGVSKPAKHCATDLRIVALPSIDPSDSVDSLRFDASPVALRIYSVAGVARHQINISNKYINKYTNGWLCKYIYVYMVTQI